MSNYIERYWRDAKPEDAIKEPPMVARFRDKSTLQWSDVQKLRGWVRQTCYGWVGEGGVWAHCQVYDAPDPGEGYRLIDPSLEEKRDGVEYLSIDGVWKPAGLCIEFQETLTYRRRIDPTVTYVPFTWDDREQLRGRWVRRIDVPDNEWMITSMYIGGGGELRANGTHADRLLSGFIFLGTGKPVGKEVIQ